MKRLVKLCSYIFATALCLSCADSDALHDDELSDNNGVYTLPLPDVPDSFVSIEERAGFVVRHFWDRVDFSNDTIYTHNREFMEQNFANYVSVFHMTDRMTLIGSVKHLLYRVRVDQVAYGLLVDVAERYLYDPTSPMIDENIYEIFLIAEAEIQRNDTARQDKISYDMSCISKNRVGTIAADFCYENYDGTKSTLLTTDTSSNDLLLIFVDPGCDKCRECVDMLEGDIVMNKMLAEHDLSILAIDINGDKQGWERVKRLYPSNWKLGLDLSGIQSDETYMMRNMPSMYLLNDDKMVLLKDAQVEALFSYLCDESGFKEHLQPTRVRL